jgi:hypothetical protein
MLSLIQDSGWGAWPVLLFTLAGLAATLTVGRKLGRPGSVAAAFALCALAAGALSFASGQHAVETFVMKLPDSALAEKVTALATGTREASGGLMLAGFGALLVMVLGGVLSLGQKRS